MTARRSSRWWRKGEDHADRAAHRSAYGGLWTDRLDAAEEIDRRSSAGTLSDSHADLLRHWVEAGYVVLPEAVDHALIDDLRNTIDRAWRDGDDRLLINPPGAASPTPLPANAPSERMRLLDVYAVVPSARAALLSPAIVDFLSLIFEDPPLLFQSLSFERGSEQGMHQDTAYVVTSSPLELAASWIALEDVQPGSGELAYYRGSHRLPEYHFSERYKHWNPERDGPEQHDEWARLLNANAARLDMEKETFRPRKGDVLIWAADLAHGGSPIADRSLTRKSLVGHYCPARVEPHYFSYRPDRRTVVPAGAGRISSLHYDLASTT